MKFFRFNFRNLLRLAVLRRAADLNGQINKTESGKTEATSFDSFF